MDAKMNNRVWAVSLMVLGITTLVLAGVHIIGMEIPDGLTRILGVIDLIALPILAFSTVKKVKNKA